MLKVLAIIGIVLGSLLALAIILTLIVLLVPFRYKVGGSNKDKLYAYLLVSFFLNFFRIRVYYREKMGWLAVRIFGIKIIDKEIPEIIDFFTKLIDKFSKKKDDKSEKDGDKSENEETGSEKSEGEDKTIDDANLEGELPEEDFEEYELSEEEIEKFLNEPDEFDDMNAIEKNISFLSSLKEFVLNIKKKWYNFKEYVNDILKKWEKAKKIIKFYWKVLQSPSLKPTLLLFWDITLKMMKHCFPRKWRMKIVYGDEDPYLTGKVHGYICMARGYFNREIDFTPVWDENIFEFDGWVGGRVQMIVFLGYAWRILTNKHLRRLILLIRKGGKIRGRK